MTILQVLIDDPLLEWTLSTDKLSKLQVDLSKDDPDLNSSVASTSTCAYHLIVSRHPTVVAGH